MACWPSGFDLYIIQANCFCIYQSGEEEQDMKAMI
jgi:hypothetical protein